MNNVVFHLLILYKKTIITNKVIANMIEKEVFFSLFKKYFFMNKYFFDSDFSINKERKVDKKCKNV